MNKSLLQKFFLSFLILFCGHTAFGQFIARDVIGAAAESFTITDLSITYVLGETVGDLLGNPDANKYLTVGFAQPDAEVQEVLNMDISKSIIVYPNPTTGGIVKLAFNHVPDGIYTIDVIDPTGRILQTQTITYSSDNLFYLPLDVSQLKGGIYFIKVVNQLNFQGQVKLIKI